MLKKYFYFTKNISFIFFVINFLNEQGKDKREYNINYANQRLTQIKK